MARKKTRNKFNFPIIGLSILGVLVIAFAVLKTSFQSAFCANSVSCIKNLTGEYDPTAKKAVFLGKNIQVPSYVAEKPNANKVLGEVPAADKRIEVDLTGQMLYAYQNNQVVMSFPISSGKWHPTPTGTFHIWVKLRYTRMTGGTGADAYDLPNVPWVMFFYNDQVGKGEGFSLHGAYWHDNFGYPMSHGCVNISPANAEKLYDWAGPVTDGNITYATDTDPGTEVVIYGTPPTE
jgi:lipoprotein-anchoring transpeptidase ErfK/SrfK